VEKLRNERDKACRERDALATKFGSAMAQLDLAREELEKLKAERDPRDNGDDTVTLPVTWEAPLSDGVWEASLNGAENHAVLFDWRFWGSLLYGLSRPKKLGKYQFRNGVGTLIESADDSGKADS